jgi:hypothetical protein
MATRSAGDACTIERNHRYSGRGEHRPEQLSQKGKWASRTVKRALLVRGVMGRCMQGGTTMNRPVRLRGGIQAAMRMAGLLVALALVVAAVPAARADDGSARKILKAMSDHVADQKSLFVNYDADVGCPRAGSQTYPSPAAEPNANGSTTVYFGPTQPAGVQRGNCVQTVQGKGWNMILRLYSPLEPFFTKTWRPGEIELVR